MKPNSFVGDLIAVDYDLDYNADAIYFGTAKALDTAGDGLGAADADGLVDDWGGTLGRVRVDSSGATITFDHESILDAGYPVLARPSVAIDENDNNWIYFGTGRFFNDRDSLDDTDNYLYGVKEPRDTSTGDNTWSNSIEEARIVDVSNISVSLSTGDLSGSYTLEATLDSETVQALDERMMSWEDSSTYQSGWKRLLDTDGERVLGEAALFGGILTNTSYAPSLETCEFTGGSLSLRHQV